MDMQHREHSKHNEYTFGWIFIQEIYLITCLYIYIYRLFKIMTIKAKPFKSDSCINYVIPQT